MKVHKRALGSLLIGLVGLGFVAPVSVAETPENNLSGSSISDVIDHNSRIDDFFKDVSIGGDAKFSFGTSYADDEIAKAARQTEALYRDLLEQQNNDNPVVRTRDLPTPFSTSIRTLQSPANFSQSDSF